MFFRTTIVASALWAGAFAHIYMVEPPSWKQNSNGPLNADGSNFPCGNQNMDDPSEVTKYAIGGKGRLATKGQAIHSGGSCQISITYDEKPTKDSQWKVIHSIIGGCPSRTATDNLGSDAEAPNADTYEFTIPDIPTGKGTFAWSWINNTGNREYYMRCAPIEITGSGGSADNYDKLPDMYIANLAPECTIPKPQGEIIYPNPGSSVEYGRAAGAQSPLLIEAPKTCVIGGTGGSPGDSTKAPPKPDSGSTPPANKDTTAPAPGAVFKEPPTKPPGTSADGVKSVIPPPADNGSQPTPGGSGAQSGACTAAGTWNCIGGTQFQQCASGTWTPAQAVAPGTKCTAGQSASLEIAAA